MVENDKVELTEAEAELYDRQIRLWGLDSQKRLRGARILLIGLKGFGAEVAKNVILSGVKSITLLDSEPLTEADSCAQFLAPTDKIGCNRAEASHDRAQALNPMVAVTVNTTPVSELPDAFFTGFEVVCATDCPQRQLVRIDGICRAAGVKFFCGHVWGMFGYTFADLQIHEFAEDIIQYKAAKHKPGEAVPTKGEAVTSTVRRTATFVPLEAALDVDWGDKQYSTRLGKRGDPSYFVMKVLLRFRTEQGRDPQPSHRSDDIPALLGLRDTVLKESNLPSTTVPDSMLRNVFAEVSPACAIVGGVLGQEVIKAVSQREPPHNNMFFFNPEKCMGFIESYGN